MNNARSDDALRYPQFPGFPQPYCWIPAPRMLLKRLSQLLSSMNGSHDVCVCVWVLKCNTTQPESATPNKQGKSKEAKRDVFVCDVRVRERES